MKKIFLLIISVLFIFTDYYKMDIVKTIKETNYIEIKKISLKQEIKSYKESNVDKNVIYLKETNFQKNFYILASHSGNSTIAYFKNLHKLQIGDDVKLHIDRKDIMFKVSNIYYEKKTGKIYLDNNMKDTLVLTTCDKFDNKKQLIVECKKFSKKKDF